MILGTLFVLATFAPDDKAVWHNYSPAGSGVMFAMPGTVHIANEKDPTGGAKVLHRYRSEFNGSEYTVVIGDVADEFVPIVNKLWSQDRKGPMVQKILDNTLKAAAAPTGGKVRLNKFGELNGFPILAQMFDNDDNSGTNIIAAFTKRGIVVAGARTPKSDADVKEGLKFIGSINLSGRK